MNKLLVFLIFCSLGFSVHAQKITVVNNDTKEPIEWVNLISEDPRGLESTNAKGEADISKFEGSAQISIHALGYKTAIKSFAALDSLGFIVGLEPTNLNLDEVVISATGFKQTSANIPSRIATITPQEAALENPQTAADLLSLSGKVFVQKSQQGGGSPMIRGFATNRLLYTVDGIRMNTAIFRGGNIQNVINLDPFAVENTEVLFGPGSVIYGSDAIGGVMRFQTLIPELSLDDEPMVFGKALMRYSSASNEKTGHFDVNVGWKKWALVSSISSWDFDDLRQGSHGPDDYIKPYFVVRADSSDHVVRQDDPLLQKPSAYSQMNFMQKVRFKPAATWDFEYGFHYSETSPYGRYDRHNRTRDGHPRYAEWNYGPQTWMLNALKITHTPETGLYDEATLRLAKQNFGESRINRGFNKDIRSIRKENVDAWSLNLDFQKALNDKHTLFYGGEAVLNEVTSKGMDEDISTGTFMDGPSRYPESSWGTVGIYLNDSYKISKKTTLQAGLRYSQYMLDANFDTSFYAFPFTEANSNSGALTGSIGGVFRPAESWVIRTNFGTAYRAPNVDDIGKVFDSEPGSVVVPNPDLVAEYAYNFDLGVAKVFGDAVKVDLTGYYTLLENAMVRRDYTLNGRDSIVYDGVMSKVQAIQNAAEAHVYGIQAGLEIKLPAGFQLSSDLNIQIGEEELDDGSTSPSRHAAPLFGVSRLTYAHEKLSLEFYAAYQGERSFDEMAVSERGKDEIYAKDKNGNNYAPKWLTLNFKARYQITEIVSVSAGIENLSDRRYRPYSSGISAPGRNFIISLRTSF